MSDKTNKLIDLNGLWIVIGFIALVLFTKSSSEPNTLAERLWAECKCTEAIE